jgi:RNA polymerase sigma factor (sigma-70 family)
MVLTVCRRVLRNEHDAEDAFQATFLVLARKAASLTVPILLGPWLYGVAYRTSLKARTTMARRRAREKKVHVPEPTPECDPELLDLLDEELNQLPEKYRIPVVLCELEGRSRKEAAAQMRIPEGTVSSRLAVAKKQLAKRLIRRGVIGAAGALSALGHGVTASAVVPRTLVQATAKAAVRVAAGQGLVAGVVSAQALTLTEGVMKAMFLSKLKGAGLMVLAVVVGMGAIGSSYGPAAPSDGPRDGTTTVRAARDEMEELRLEIAALRKGLEVTREQVKTLQGELQTLKATQARAAGWESGAAQPNKNHDTEKELQALNAGQAEVYRTYLRALGEADLTQVNQQDLKAFERWKLGRAAAGQPKPNQPSSNKPNPGGSQQALNYNRLRVNQPADPLAEAQEALKKLRANANDKEASDALERALLSWRKQKGEGDKPSKP